jgi:hypothetical protein
MDTIYNDFEFSKELQNEMLKKNFLKNITKQIVFALRDNKSQEYMNKKLNFKFNQYAKWEKGIKTINWNDVISICQIQKIKLDGLVVRFHLDQKNINKSDLKIIQFFLKTFFKNKIEYMSKYIGVSAPVIRRMINTKKDVPFEIILKLFLYQPLFIIYFLNELKMLELFPDFQKEFKRLESLEQLEAIYPFFFPVLYFTETTTYQKLKIHSSKVIADNVGLNIDQVNLALELLKEKNLLIYKNKKYFLNQSATELNSLSIEQRIKIINYWNYRSVSYLYGKISNPNPGKTKNHTSFRVFTTTDKVANAISEKLAQTYYEINQMIKESEVTNTDEVVLKVLQINYFGIEESTPLEFESDLNQGFILKTKK